MQLPFAPAWVSRRTKRECKKQRMDSIEELPESAHFTKSQVVVAWGSLWLVVWVSASVLGAAFGLAVGVLHLMSRGDFQVLLGGPFFGFAYVGYVGFMILPTFGIICWMFWLLKNPLFLASLSGGIVGGLAGLCGFFLTGPLAAFVAYIAVQRFMKTDIGRPLLLQQSDHWHRVRNESVGHDEAWEFGAGNESEVGFQFTTMDLFWRTTAVAALIAFWSFVIRSLY